MDDADSVIYADYNATTPCLPDVADLMQRILLGDFGNPSHRASVFGRKARTHLDTAREQVARAVGSEADEIIFTSGATEACNMAILGVMQRLMRERPRILSAATEHPAVCMPADYCGSAGAQWVELPVDANGRLDLEEFKQEIDSRTALVCVMAANNETGVLQDIPLLARLCHDQGALLFCDMTQALGKLQFNVRDWGVDFACFSAHKLYGPKGAGALFKRRGLALPPLLRGGGQENGLRSGTENVPAIAGFGLAADHATRELHSRRAHLGRLTTMLEGLVTQSLPGVLIQGQDVPRIPGTSMFSHPGLSGNWLPQLSDVVATSGSACASAQEKPSHTLMAMGNTEAIARRSVRISLGMPSTEAEVRHIAHRLVVGAERLLVR